MPDLPLQICTANLIGKVCIMSYTRTSSSLKIQTQRKLRHRSAQYDECLTSRNAGIINCVIEPSLQHRSREYAEQVLGWLVCAKRTLRWREVQGAVSQLYIASTDKMVERGLVYIPSRFFKKKKGATLFVFVHWFAVASQLKWQDVEKTSQLHSARRFKIGNLSQTVIFPDQTAEQTIVHGCAAPHIVCRIEMQALEKVVLMYFEQLLQGSDAKSE